MSSLAEAVLSCATALGSNRSKAAAWIDSNSAENGEQGAGAGTDAGTGGAGTDAGTGGAGTGGMPEGGSTGSQSSSGGGEAAGGQGGGFTSGGSAAGGSAEGGTASGGADGTGGTVSGPMVPGDKCSFLVEHNRSLQISTVEIVTWSSDLEDLTAARIEFGPSGNVEKWSAPVDLSEPDFRTVLFGMKAESDYVFRLVAESAETTCTSAQVGLTTGSLPGFVPTIERDFSEPGASEGFIVAAPGAGASGLSAGFIFDTDGDVVWWAPAVDGEMVSARLSWDAKKMWCVGATSLLYEINVDGSGWTPLNDLAMAHHDLTPLPEGGFAVLWRDGFPPEAVENLVQRRPDGTLEVLVSDLNDLYSTDPLHPNKVHYHQADDSFTISDRNLDGFVKLSRNGDLVWQLGGEAPLGDSFDLVGLTAWDVNHGHHYLEDGRFLFFNNYSEGVSEGPAKLIEVQLDEKAWTAEMTWEYTGEDSGILGDVQMLPGGNVLATYSASGIMDEVDGAGKILQRFRGAKFGYAEFRSSLYGPPAR